MEDDDSGDLFGIEAEDCALVWPEELTGLCGVVEDELRVAERVLQALLQHPEALQHPYLKDFRTLGIGAFLKSTAGTFYGGNDNRKDYLERKARRKENKRKEQQMRQLDFNHQNASKLRRERLEALAKQEEHAVRTFHW